MAFVIAKAAYLPQGKVLGLRLGQVVWAGILGQFIPPINIDQVLLSSRDYDEFNRSLEKTRRSDSDVDPSPQRSDGNPTPNDNETRADPGRPAPLGDPAQG